MYVTRKKIFYCCIAWLIYCGTASNHLYAQPDFEKVVTCSKSWEYKDLQAEEELTVLLFNPKEGHSLCRFPNFLIGINREGDTIAITDRDFGGEVTPGDTVIVDPYHWPGFENGPCSFLVIVYKESSMNDLYCGIEAVYFGSIKLTKKVARRGCFFKRKKK